MEPDKYLEKINKIKSHIQNGDIYEMNYCQEFYSFGKDIDPRSVFLNLNVLLYQSIYFLPKHYHLEYQYI